MRRTKTMGNSSWVCRTPIPCDDPRREPGAHASLGRRWRCVRGAAGGGSPRGGGRVMTTEARHRDLTRAGEAGTLRLWSTTTVGSPSAEEHDTDAPRLYLRSYSPAHQKSAGDHRVLSEDVLCHPRDR